MTVCWVTGGGTGIGRALAGQLMRQGARVVITGRRIEILQEAARQLAALPGGGQVMAIVGDASDPAHAQEVISQVSGKWGAITLLVNNAGENLHSSHSETTSEEYLKSFKINCLSAINCTQSVLPEMLKRGVGKVVNISSIYGRWASSDSPSYSVGKYAVTGYTDSLRQALIHTPIQVLGVFPGFIRTDMTSPFVVSGTLRAKMGKSPDQMARAILAALKTKKAELYYPWYVTWVLRLHRWFPRLSDLWARRMKR